MYIKNLEKNKAIIKISEKSILKKMAIKYLRDPNYKNLYLQKDTNELKEIDNKIFRLKEIENKLNESINKILKNNVKIYEICQNGINSLSKKI